MAIAATCGSATDPLADLKAGAAALDAKRYHGGDRHAGAAGETAAENRRLRGVFHRFGEIRVGRLTRESPKALDPVFKMTPVSPLASRAVLLQAHAPYDAERTTAKAALEFCARICDAAAAAVDLAMATAFAAAGDSHERRGLSSARLLRVSAVGRGGDNRMRS